MDLVDIEKEIAEEYKKYYENAIYYAKKIKEKAFEIFKEKLIDIYLFGSVAKGKYIPLKSDIDILIVVDLPSEIIRKAFWKAKIVTEILESLRLPDIFQIHIINKEDFEKFEKMIDYKIKI